MPQDFDKPRNNGRVGLPPVGLGMNKIAPNAIGGGKGARGEAKIITLGQQKKRDQGNLLARAVKRFSYISKAEAENRRAGLEDLKFLAGEQQWPADVAAQRNFDRRPTLQVNALKTLWHQVINDMRQNRPEIYISPVGDRSDKYAAKMFRGLIRAIQRNCSADVAYDTAAQNAVANGWGYWRIATEYEAPNSFDQVIVIERVRNPFSIYLDPDHLEPDGSDARYAFVSELMPREEFEELYPQADPMPWQPAGIGESMKQWIDQDHVRIAEYFEMSEQPQTLVALDNGWTGWKDEISEEVQALIDSRDIRIEREELRRTKRITWHKMSARDILAERSWPGRWIPIVKMVGDEIDIEGDVRLSGIIRDAKDPQRILNFAKTSEVEVTMLAPKAPYIGAEGQFDGHVDQWKEANQRNFPFLQYNPKTLDGQLLPPPQRSNPAPIPAGIVNLEQGAAQDLIRTTGIRSDVSMTLNGRMLDESGKAMMENRRTSDIGAYHYTDNMARSLRHTGKILLDLIPKIYDRKRVLTILREDDQDQQVTLDPNAPQPYQEQRDAKGKVALIFNPTIGAYGVAVTIGQSYATKRIEAAENMLNFMKAVPQVAPLIADLAAKEMDFEGAEEMATRLSKALPPGLLTPEMKDVPPQVQALLQQLSEQVQLLTQERQQLMAALNDQSADRAQRQDEINKAYDAKLQATQEKFAEALIKIEAKGQESGQKTDIEFVKLFMGQITAAGEKIEKEAGTMEKVKELTEGFRDFIADFAEKQKDVMEKLRGGQDELRDRYADMDSRHKDEIAEIKKAVNKPRKIKLTRDAKTGRVTEAVATADETVH